MIFVTLGTGDKGFERLLKKIDELIDKKIISEKVIVQCGSTKYESKNMEIHEMFSQDEFEKVIKKANLVIAHGGVGSINTALMYDKKVIAVSRLKEYDEIANNHQKEIVSKYNEEGYIIGITSLDDLEKSYKKIDKFIPKKPVSNNENFINKLVSYIDSTNNTSFINKIYNFFHKNNK